MLPSGVRSRLQTVKREASRKPESFIGRSSSLLRLTGWDQISLTSSWICVCIYSVHCTEYRFKNINWLTDIILFAFFPILWRFPFDRGNMYILEFNMLVMVCIEKFPFYPSRTGKTQSRYAFELITFSSCKGNMSGLAEVGFESSRTVPGD